MAVRLWEFESPLSHHDEGPSRWGRPFDVLDSPGMRAALPSLLLLAACAAPVPQTTAPREPLIHVDVPAKVAEGTASGSFKADWSFDLVASEEWSAHVHVIPQGQLVPPHRHPENDELVFVAAGTGEWQSWTSDGPVGGDRGPGAALVAPAGVVHSIRNRRPEPLATVVVQRPEFGQNWYLLPDEVTGDAVATDVGAQPPPGFDGWTIAWTDAVDVPAANADTLLLVAEGRGGLQFEDKTLSVTAGTFVKVPPNLEVGGLSAQGLRVLRITIPR